MSVPPPSPAAAPAAVPPARELVVRLEAPRGLIRRAAVASEESFLRFTPEGVELRHERALARPLRVPLASVALAAVDPGPAKAKDPAGRLPVLRRVSRSSVIPREEGIEGWLWTTRGGSALPSLAEDDAPNGVLLFTKPLAGDAVACFAPDWIEALAARSPLGDPVVPGLLLRVAEPGAAEDVFRRYRVALPLTDREIPPVMRRSLPTDVPADPLLRGGGDEARARTSVAPPGF